MFFFNPGDEGTYSGSGRPAVPEAAVTAIPALDRGLGCLDGDLVRDQSGASRFVPLCARGWKTFVPTGDQHTRV